MEFYKAKLYANDEISDIIVKEENNVYSEICTNIEIEMVNVFNMKTSSPYIRDLEECNDLKEIQRYIRHFKYESFLDIVSCDRKSRKKLKSKMKIRRQIMMKER